MLDESNHSGIAVRFELFIIISFQSVVRPWRFIRIDSVLEICNKSFLFCWHFYEHGLVVNHAPTGINFTMCDNCRIRLQSDFSFSCFICKLEFMLCLNDLNHIREPVLANFFDFKNVRFKRIIFIDSPITINISF
jgi:hypothetical protein